MQIEVVTAATEELVAAFARLVPQLTNARPPDLAELAAVAANANLIVARDGGGIVGSLTLLVYRIPSGTHARIDDVVVDAAVRGRGIGEALTRYAIDLARASGARRLHLTSHPRRDAANRLYQRLGFEQRETNVYSLGLA